ncbi:MAG: hypothetical protein WBC68_13260, partial [Albidovulum sp.]
PEIVETSGGGKLFGTEDDLIDAMRALQSDPEGRAKQARAARNAFETIWHETPVMEAYGATFAQAAHKRGDHALARALDGGAFQHGAGIAI